MNYARNGGRPQRLAECRGLAPLARRHALVSTEARLACPVDIPDWPAESKLGRAKAGPRGRTCTCNISVLSGTPLHWATRGGAHGRICAGTLRVLSAPSLRWTTWAKWPAEPKLGERRLEPLVGLAPSVGTRPPYEFTKLVLWLLRHRGKMASTAGIAPASVCTRPPHLRTVAL